MYTLILPDNYKIEILRTLKDLEKDIRRDIYDLIDIIKEDFIINEILDLIHKYILKNYIKIIEMDYHIADPQLVKYLDIETNEKSLSLSLCNKRVFYEGTIRKPF